MKLFSQNTLKSAVIGLIVAPLSMVAQIDRTQAPSAGPAPIIELGESTVSTLSNGLKVIVVENHRLPKISWSLTLEHTPYFEGNKAGMLELNLCQKLSLTKLLIS
jgi:zinc protease